MVYFVWRHEGWLVLMSPLCEGLSISTGAGYPRFYRFLSFSRCLLPVAGAANWGRRLLVWPTRIANLRDRTGRPVELFLLIGVVFVDADNGRRPFVVPVDRSFSSLLPMFCSETTKTTRPRSLIAFHQKSSWKLDKTRQSPPRTGIDGESLRLLIGETR